MRDRMKDKAILLIEPLLFSHRKIQEWKCSGNMVIREAIIKGWLERSLQIRNLANNKIRRSCQNSWWMHGSCFISFSSPQIHSLHLLSFNKHTERAQRRGSSCTLESRVLRRTYNRSYTMMKHNVMRHFSNKKSCLAETHTYKRSNQTIGKSQEYEFWPHVRSQKKKKKDWF